MNKPNERHERFCREYVRRPVGSAAALAAGYSEDNAAGAGLPIVGAGPIFRCGSPSCATRLPPGNAGDVSAVLARLQVIYELAIEQNQFSTALRAVALQLRVSGMVPEGRGGTRRAGPDYGGDALGNRRHGRSGATGDGTCCGARWIAAGTLARERKR